MKVSYKCYDCNHEEQAEPRQEILCKTCGNLMKEKYFSPDFSQLKKDIEEKNKNNKDIKINFKYFSPSMSYAKEILEELKKSGKY